MGRYDRAAALAYGERWALGRNPAYFDFQNFGGDCTNFVSQCLYAGCGEMNDTPVRGWYYRDSTRRTASWTGVEYLYQFLTGNRGRGPRAAVAARAQIVPGDVVQLGDASGAFYHSQLVVAVTASEIYIAAHTNDQWRRALSDYNYGRARFLHVQDAWG